MNRTSYLFSRPSVTRGVARLADLGGSLNRGAYRLFDAPGKSDARALGADWLAVGDDMRAAIAEFTGNLENAKA